MKEYRIVNKRSRNTKLASLIYDDNKKEFHIVIPRHQNEKKLPMLLKASVQKNIYEMGADISMAWVRNRIIPCERQNIGHFLKSYGMDSYREDLILEKTEGRSIQDDYMVIRES